MIRKDMELYLESQAKDYDIDLAVLVGISQVESSCSWEAERYEKTYRWMVDANTGRAFRKLQLSEYSSETPPKDFKGLKGVTTSEEEWIGQRTSFGCMQVMGAVARELGFKGKFSELNGRAGAVYAIKHFLRLKERFYAKHGMEGVIEAYNRGSPLPGKTTDYAKKVMNSADYYRHSVGR